MRAVARCGSQKVRSTFWNHLNRLLDFAGSRVFNDFVQNWLDLKKWISVLVLLLFWFFKDWCLIYFYEMKLRKNDQQDEHEPAYELRPYEELLLFVQKWKKSLKLLGFKRKAIAERLVTQVLLIKIAAKSMSWRLKAHRRRQPYMMNMVKVDLRMLICICC